MPLDIPAHECTARCGARTLREVELAALAAAFRRDPDFYWACWSGERTEFIMDREGES